MIQRRKVYLFYCPLGFLSQVNIYSHTHKSGSDCKIKKFQDKMSKSHLGMQYTCTALSYHYRFQNLLLIPFGDIDHYFFWIHNSVIFGSNEIFHTKDPLPKKQAKIIGVCKVELIDLFFVHYHLILGFKSNLKRDYCQQEFDRKGYILRKSKFIEINIYFKVRTQIWFSEYN